MSNGFKRPRHRRGRGFSLIEMAVVMIVIGLMLTAVLQGRELIANAEYKSFKSGLNDYGKAFYIFRDRYNALPGDFDEAESRLDLDATDNGDGNGMIDDGPGCDGAGEESCAAWQHLRAAGLLKGDPDVAGTEAPPSHPYTGTVSGFFTGTEGDGIFGHNILVESVPSEIARRLDNELDNGSCEDGRISMYESGQSCDGEDWPSDATVSFIYAL